MEGFRPYELKDAAKYTEKRWWLGLTMGDMFDKTCDLYPEKQGLVDADRHFTYGQLRTMVDNLAFGFLKAGFRPGDRVLLQLPNWAEFIMAYYALQKAGLVMVLLTVNHTAREIIHLAGLTRPRGWILPAEYRHTDYRDLISRVRLDNPCLETVMVIGSDPPQGCLDFHTLLEAKNNGPEKTSALAAVRPDPGAVCQILPSGGTTGLPKGAPRTHNDYLSNVEYVSKAWFLGPDDVCLVATTVGHNLALLVTINGAIFHGATVVLLDSTRPEDFCRTVEKEKVTATGLVPTMVSRVVGYDGLASYDLSSLRRVYVGAANSPPELVKKVEEKIGGLYINAFGMVEGPCAQTRPYHPFEVRTGSIGLPTCPYDHIVTLDPLGQITPPGTEGELAAKGPGIFTGYYQNPQANQSSFTPDGYFRTGDLATIDERGMIRITGRIKDIIIRGGENIAARDVEELISTYPGVEYVAVVGMPDQDLGETVCAYVKTLEGYEVSFEELLDYLKGLDSGKALLPARIEFVTEIPLTAAGKADKKFLRQDIEKKIDQERSN